MAGKKVVQVPMDVELLSRLDGMARARGQSRSQIIREAAQRYLVAARLDELDRAYEEGYRRLPEDAALGDGLAAAAVEMLAEEPW